MNAPIRPRLKLLYETELRDALLKQFEYDNVMQVPKLEKIVLNMGVGEAVADKKRLQNAMEELALMQDLRSVMGC
jgi:large subunit ribosomal protein L5